MCVREKGKKLTCGSALSARERREEEKEKGRRVEDPDWAGFDPNSRKRGLALFPFWPV